MKIVQADESHVDQITELWKELVDYHRGLEGFYSRREAGEVSFMNYLSGCITSDECLALVSLEGEEVVGYAISMRTQHPPVWQIESYGLITDMAVKSGHRRKGTGSGLLLEILDWFASRGINRIELHVAAANPIGRSFWTKHGFKVYEHVLYLNYRQPGR